MFKSITYGASQEAGVIQSNSRVGIVGGTPGYASSGGSFEMLVTEINAFFADLTGGNAVAITSVYFDISVSYSSNSIDVQTDVLRGCRITSIDANNQGSDATSKSCKFTVTTMVLDGVVAYGDTSAGSKPLDPYGTQATPIASDFWFSPVFEADNGDHVAPGFWGDTYAKDPWDAVTMSLPFKGREQPKTPGICEVRVTKERRHDKKKPKGTDGARVTLHGIDAAEGEIAVTVWTPQQFRALQEQWRAFFPGPQKFVTTTNVHSGGTRDTTTVVISGGQQVSSMTIPQAKLASKVTSTQSKTITQPFDVDHPKFSMHNIRSVVFVAGSGPDPGPTPFSRVFVMKWIEFFPPGKINATNTPKGSSVQPRGSVYDTPGTNPSNVGP